MSFWLDQLTLSFLSNRWELKEVDWAPLKYLSLVKGIPLAQGLAETDVSVRPMRIVLPGYTRLSFLLFQEKGLLAELDTPKGVFCSLPTLVVIQLKYELLPLSSGCYSWFSSLLRSVSCNPSLSWWRLAWNIKFLTLERCEIRMSRLWEVYELGSINSRSGCKAKSFAE